MLRILNTVIDILLNCNFRHCSNNIKAVLWLWKRSPIYSLTQQGHVGRKRRANIFVFVRPTLGILACFDGIDLSFDLLNVTQNVFVMFSTDLVGSKWLQSRSAHRDTLDDDSRTWVLTHNVAHVLSVKIIASTINVNRRKINTFSRTY